MNGTRKMKYSAIHDERGTLEALMIQPEDGPAASIASTAGQAMSEVDDPGFGIDPRDPRTLEDLAEDIADYRVERQAARLTRSGQPRK